MAIRQGCPVLGPQWTLGHLPRPPTASPARQVKCRLPARPCGRRAHWPLPPFTTSSRSPRPLTHQAGTHQQPCGLVSTPTPPAFACALPPAESPRTGARGPLLALQRSAEESPARESSLTTLPEVHLPCPSLSHPRAVLPNV